jgi:cell division protease FtsH
VLFWRKRLNKNLRNALIWLGIFWGLFFVVNPFNGQYLTNSPKEFSYSKFMSHARNGDIKEVLVRNNSCKIVGRTVGGKMFATITPPNNDKMIETLMDNNVDVQISSGESGWDSFFSQIFSWLPMILILALMIYSVRQMRGKGGAGTGGPLGIGKSKARMFQDKKIKVRFADVAGIDEAKAELEEIVDFLKNPKKFQRLGGKIPKGVLLVGAPGNGKTLLARAIAGEASVPFFSISGSDFVEVFVGVGASRVRDMFEHAKKSSPCIVFIDEIDAVGRQRDSVMRSGNDEREQTLNQLLVEMDGFEENQGVIVLAATNRPDVLDHALLRPGRFDRQIAVQYPDMNGREKILKVHAKEVPLDEDVNLRVIAQGTPGFSGAELANLINEAALLAARFEKAAVSMQDLEMAKDRVLMGSERRSMIMDESEKRRTAYHEAGHALVALFVPSATKIHKVTIIPRGHSLGMVMRLPEKDKLSESKIELLSDIKVAMGGRVAEEIFFGRDHVTTGASSDIKGATDIAKKMIINWGMSDKLGFRSFVDDNGGYILSSSDKFSEQTSEIIDAEIKSIMDTCYAEVVKLITEHKNKIEKIVEYLIAYETLTGDEVKKIFNGEEIVRDASSTANPPPTTSV